ncbi:MAG: L,D-transpeptidase [Bryobacteraceae bacterium]
MRWQLKYFRALAALLVAASEALAQEMRPVARRIVVSIPDRKLALVEDGRAVKIYPVAVGAAHTPSPAGSFTVIVRVAHPTWYGPGKVVPPGKSNPLGPRWIGLSRTGYGIHGTSNPRSIGRPASHGCIRMQNTDVEELFGLVAIGDAVELYAERTGEVARLFGAADGSMTVAAAEQHVHHPEGAYGDAGYAIHRAHAAIGDLVAQ